jgi:hypothetical protein
VPEPAALGILALGGGLVLLRQGRTTRAPLTPARGK